jgi:acetylornithine/LysW-gamma-L-lysine aminotransferase
MELQQQYEFDVYPKREVTIVKGKGAKVWDDKGNEYIDCVAGISVANVGHSNDSVVKAITKQAETLITCPGIFYNDTKAKFLEKLISITPKSLTKAFICNSGAEAIEAAIKFARYTTKKTEIITAMKGFHGRTYGGMTATAKKEYKEPFAPLLPGFVHVPYNNFVKLENAVNENTAAIILELIQGEGGINIAKEDYVQKVRNLCNEKGILFIVDEIQTGFCRTGKMFASEHYNVEPDIMCVAKSMGGGVPVGATVCSDKIEVPKGKHGSTFGGNPLACAASIASIDFMIENNLAERSVELGEYFVNKLKEHDLAKVREIRNKGLMVGIELKEKVQPYILKLMEERVLCLPAGPIVMRLLPPLTIEKEELDFVVEKLVKVL